MKLRCTKAYAAKLDSKRRIVLRGATAKYYHVKELRNGEIHLSPRKLVASER